ncbi:Chitin biosynthesis protein CHS5 [Candida viswanathii]|uniref:Chitin biosynthesis protein CHS5 n=1 Tax=Candida viswanathii TaxID=5486 RepID=A0A367XMM1_9ASCO|nr:Chitin biosynthesis protein CHS5 [Candida viswanathii]
MVEVSLTVGKLDASLALLLTKDHHLIEFPTILLPNGVRAGSIIKIKCDQDFESEKEEAAKFNSIQEEILNTFATNLPEPPNLKIKNVTQTSCVLEWDKLNLGTSNLKNLILFKDGKKLGSIPQPLSNRTSKLSGLPIDKSFKVQLRLDTTAGVFLSNEIEVTTHKMTDLSGITVCLGDLTPNDQFNKQDIEDTLKNMGAKFPTQTQVKVDTTHFLCTRENKQNPEYVKANDMNIPIIRPEWLKACERERRIVGVRDFYVKECVLPDLFAKNYWQKNNATAATAAAAGTTNDATAENENPPVPEKEVEKPAAEEPAGTKSAAEVPVEEPTKEEEAAKPEETSNEGEEPAKEEAAAKPEEEAPVEPAQAAEVQSDTPKDTEEPAKEPEADLTEASAPLEEKETEPGVPVINVEPAKEENLNEEEAEPLDVEEAEPLDVEETKQTIDDAFDSVPLEDENVAIEESKPVEQEARDGDLAEAKELETAPVIGNGGNKENEEENGEENGEEDGEEDGDEDDDGEDENEDEAVPTEGTPTPAGDKKKKKKKKNKNKGKK